jgi:superoxide dismutase, Cu-Zn family
MKLFISAALLLFASGACLIQETRAQSAAKSIVVALKNAQGQTVGTATLSAVPKGVKLVLDIKSLPPGQHSIHIHQFGKCDPPDFKSAGPHFDGSGTGHDHDHAMAGMSPAGDIPDFSLIVAADGTAHVTTVAPNVTLGTDDHSVFSGGGTALVIHDVASQTGSAAPPRIACGVISKPQ